jgi:putative lipoic acid-binding regulatory protein
LTYEKLRIEMQFLGLKEAEKKKLEFEVISDHSRLKLTRLLRHATRAQSSVVKIVLQNNAINIARNVLGLPIYELEAEDGDYYYPSEYGWHNAEIELAMRRPDTADLVETLADLIQEGVFDTDSVNKILEGDNASFSFSSAGNLDDMDVSVTIMSIEEIEELHHVDDDHPNIRLLISRMNSALDSGDNSGVLHASACVFETLAKDIISVESIQNQTLASFFDRYRNESELPNEILDYILTIYKRRNIEPLAGHGSTQTTSIGNKDAVILAEMTRAFVRIERQLSSMSIRVEGSEKRE